MRWIQPPVIILGKPPRPGLISYRRLTWNDFTVRNVSSGASAQTGAVLYATYKWGWTSVGRKFTGELTQVSIGAWFDPIASWRKPDVKSDNVSLLEHEQRHFDLCEVGARRLRDQLLILNWSPVGTSESQIREQIEGRLTPLINDFIQDVKTQQENYDRESNHSQNKRSQQVWNRRIQAELDRLTPLGL